MSKNASEDPRHDDRAASSHDHNAWGRNHHTLRGSCRARSGIGHQPLQVVLAGTLPLHLAGERDAREQEGEAMNIRMAITSAAVVLIPVLAAAQKVTYDYDRSKNFTHVRTFTVKEGEPSHNPLVDQRVAAQIARTLAARGMSQVDHDPDVYIVPSLTAEMRKEYTAYNTGYWPYYGGWYGGYWGYWGGGWGSTTVQERERQYDTLVIDMVDARTGTLIWRGKGVKRVHSHWKPDDVDKQVAKTVGKIMSNFPPGYGD
jgi:Domain of unknown function (DUF4136)